MGDYIGDQLAANMDDLRQAASTAALTAQNIDGHKTALRGMADSATSRAVWDGTAVVAFTTAHEAWEQGVVRLVTALAALGDGTQITADDYTATDSDISSNLASVAGQSPFNGALASTA